MAQGVTRSSCIPLEASNLSDIIWMTELHQTLVSTIFEAQSGAAKLHMVRPSETYWDAPFINYQEDEIFL